MQTYQFTAYQNQRYYACGEARADSPQEAKAKILERYFEEGLEFDEYVEGDVPDCFRLTDEAGGDHYFQDQTPADVFPALTALIERAGDLIAAMQPAPAQAGGVTDEFGHEVSALRDAAGAAEKAMQPAGGVS